MFAFPFILEKLSLHKIEDYVNQIGDKEKRKLILRKELS